MSKAAAHMVFALLLAPYCAGCMGAIGDTEEQPVVIEPPPPPLPLVVKGSAPRALSNEEYRRSLSSLLGYDVPLALFAGWTPSTTFSGFDGVIWSGFSGQATLDRIALVEALMDSVVGQARVMICEPDGADASSCARTIIGAFAARAYRRPLLDAELAELMGRYQTAYVLAKADAPSWRDQFHEGIRVTLASVMLSPQLMVRLEPLPAEGERALDAYELAARLAFFMTGAPPDDELWAAAADGSILLDDTLRAQALRLLFTRTADFVDTFGGQLFDFRQLASARAGVLEAWFYAESAAVLIEIIRRELPVRSVVAPGFTFLNAALAEHYGIGPPPYTYTSDALVRFDTLERGGILQQASVLSLTSTPNKTSPQRRGRWVQSRLLCKTIPPPDAALFAQIAAVSASIPETATVKERVDRHRTAGDVCMSCHQYMDPIGLGLESFDPRGRKRAYYDQAALYPVETDSDLLGEPFATFDELNGMLAALPEINACMAEKMVIHGLGQMLAPRDDQGLIDYLSAEVDGHEPSFADMVVRLVSSAPFRRIARAAEDPS